MSVGDLLPPNSTAFERAVAEGMTDRLPIPLREIMDPVETPSKWLPWLAAHRSVDLWYSDWSTARKRDMVAHAIPLARLKGTRAAATAFLPYVDAVLIDRITYPARFVLSRSTPSFAPLQHPPFKSRYLVKISLRRPVNALVSGRSALGRAALRTVDQEPARRARRALTVAKGGDNHLEYRVSFGWRRPATFADALPPDMVPIGAFVDRIRL